MKTNIKRESTKSLVRLIESIIEVGVLSVIYYLFWRFGYDVPGLFAFKGKYVLMGIYAVITFFLFKNMDGFEFGNLRRIDLALAQWIGSLMVNFITYFQLCLIENSLINPVPMLLLVVADVIVSTIFVFSYTYLYHIIYPPYKMLMIFGTDTALGLKIKIDSRWDKYHIEKLISAEEDFDKICKEILNYQAVVINDVPAQIKNDILKFCYQNEIRSYVVPKITDLIMRGAKTVNTFDTPIFLVKGTGLTIVQRTIKRLMDIIMSLIVLIPAAPVMLIVALAIKLEDGGPAFYKQDRVTIGGKEFGILKFRSMIVDAEKYSGAVLAEDNDPRITKVGKFIRATRLDELPQILNILKGDMSVVGPRPERRTFIEEFCKDMPEFTYRLKVKGGLTGYAQIYGKYNTGAYDKLRLDLMYIENYSLLLDIKLILTTIRIMFSKDSTEGMDKARENEKLVQDLIEETHKNKD